MHLAQMRAGEKGEASALSLIGGKIGFPATDPASQLALKGEGAGRDPSPLLLLLDIAVVASSSSRGGAGIAYFIPCSVDASRRISCCFALCSERASGVFASICTSTEHGVGWVRLRLRSRNFLSRLVLHVACVRRACCC